jgi:DNA-directed RNA polymerase specialized sigma24 family protein
MTPNELLETALDAAGYFVKSSNPSATYGYLCGYTIEDLAMDVVVKLLGSKVDLSDLSKTYVIRTAYTVALDIRRLNRPHLVNCSVPEANEPQGPLLSFDDTEESIFGMLPESQKDVYTLSIVLGWTDEATGDYLGISDRSVRRRLVPIKENIRRYLDVNAS